MKRVGIKAIRVANMQTLIKQRKNQREFAEFAGLNPAYVSQMLNGVRDIGEEVARRIEEAFSKPVGWIDREHQISEVPTAYLARNVTPAQVAHHQIPLISWIQAGNFAEVIDHLQPGDAEELLPCPLPSGPHAFALTVRGPSMEPEYRDGDIIYVDPDRPADNGSHVVVRLADGDEATFKRLVIDGGKTYLEALNPDWPARIIPINGEAFIVGVVFFSGRRR